MTKSTTIKTKKNKKKTKTKTKKLENPNEKKKKKKIKRCLSVKFFLSYSRDKNRKFSLTSFTRSLVAHGFHIINMYEK